MSTSLHITLASFLPQISYAAASITASYTGAGSFASGIACISIVSTLDAAVQISFDGVNDHVAVPAGSAEPVYITFNFAANRSAFNPTGVFVKRIGTPTTGSLYVSAFTRA